MKILQGIGSILAGYAAAIAYFTVCMLAHGEGISNDYWVVLFWVAFVGIGTMLVLFLIPFLASRGSALFWRMYICGPLGAIAGFLALYKMFPEIAGHYMYGGQAALMSAVTFMTGAKVLRKRAQA